MREAQLRCEPLTVITVVAGRGRRLARHGRYPSRQEIVADARTWPAEAAAKAAAQLGQAAPSTTTVQAVVGLPAEVLVDVSLGADLLVVGSRGDGRLLQADDGLRQQSGRPPRALPGRRRPHGPACIDQRTHHGAHVTGVGSVVNARGVTSDTSSRGGECRVFPAYRATTTAAASAVPIVSFIIGPSFPLGGCIPPKPVTCCCHREHVFQLLPLRSPVASGSAGGQSWTGPLARLTGPPAERDGAGRGPDR